MIIFSDFFFPLQLHGTKIKGWKIETWIFNLPVTLADFSKHSFPAAWLQGRVATKSLMRASLSRKAHNLYTNSVNAKTFAEELSKKRALHSSPLQPTVINSIIENYNQFQVKWQPPSILHWRGWGNGWWVESERSWGWEGKIGSKRN